MKLLVPFSLWHTGREGESTRRCRLFEWKDSLSFLLLDFSTGNGCRCTLHFPLPVASHRVTRRRRRSIVSFSMLRPFAILHQLRWPSDSYSLPSCLNFCAPSFLPPSLFISHLSVRWCIVRSWSLVSLRQRNISFKIECEMKVMSCPWRRHSPPPLRHHRCTQAIEWSDRWEKKMMKQIYMHVYMIQLIKTVFQGHMVTTVFLICDRTSRASRLMLYRCDSHFMCHCVALSMSLSLLFLSTAAAGGDIFLF